MMCTRKLKEMEGLIRNLVVVDFPFHDIAKEHKDDMFDQYLKKIDPDKGFNIEYTNEPLMSKLRDEFEKVVKDNFEVDDVRVPIKSYIYCQDDFHGVYKLHNHISTATISGVMYVDPPKDGGELLLFEDGEFYKQTIEKDKIYLFPYWVWHQPTPQKDKLIRISINFEYKCTKRPLHKVSKQMW